MAKSITISKPLGQNDIAMGGPGSGNWGHKGRPGQVGGSAPRGGGARSSGATAPWRVGRLDANSWDVSFDNVAGEHIRQPLTPGGRPIRQSQMESLDLRGEIKDGIVRTISEESGEEYYAVNEVVGQWAKTSNDNNYAALSIQEAAAEEFGVSLSPWQQQKLDTFFVAPEQKAKLHAEWDLAEDKVNEALARWQADDYKQDSPAYERFDAVQKAAKDASVRYHSAHIRGDRTDPDAIGILDDLLGEGDSRKAARRILRTVYNHTQRELEAQGVKTVKLFRGVQGQDDNLPQGEVVQVKQNALSSWSASFTTAKRFGSRVLAMEVPVSRVFCTARTGMGCLSEMEFILLGNTADADTAYVMQGVVSR